MNISVKGELLCWPRMSLYEAASRWDGARGESLQGIANGIDMVSIPGEYYPLARRRAGAENLAALRTLVVELARSFGYPSLVRGRRLIEFDQALGAAVHEQMRIMPADAACADVWNFVNAVVVPDVVLWRHGKFDDVKKRWTISEDRLFDLTRTTVGRLWWRVHLLGEDVAKELGEDEAVQLLEKPRIGGYMRLSRAIGQRHLHYVAVAGTTRRMELLRDVTKRFIRKMAVLSVYAMDAEQLENFVNELFVESATALGIALKEPAEPQMEFSSSRMRFATD